MEFKRAGVTIGALLFLLGCTEATVQVPPEVDLQRAGIKSVAVVAVDLPNDPAPVGVLLRAETSAQIRRLLPTLALVEDPQQADAVLQMEVANHGVGPAYFQNKADTQTGHVYCEAWQEAFLLVNASVYAKGTSSPWWESLLEKRNRIDLSCRPNQGSLGMIQSPAVDDPQLVNATVTELGMRLAGYTRKELRPKHSSNQP